MLRSGGNGEFVGAVPAPAGPARYPLFKYQVPNMLTGSLLNLTPDTEYEARFTLSDPDGGNATKTVTFRTRKEPMPAAGGHVYHVYPVDWKGPKQEPNFPSLMAAYLQGGAHYDYENAYPRAGAARRHHPGACRRSISATAFITSTPIPGPAICRWAIISTAPIISPAAAPPRSPS